MTSIARWRPTRRSSASTRGTSRPWRSTSRARWPLVGRAAECGATVVAESGIGGPDDVARAADAGAAAVLVGTSLLREADPAAAVARLVEAAPSRRAAALAGFARRVPR